MYWQCSKFVGVSLTVAYLQFDTSWNCIHRNSAKIKKFLFKKMHMKLLFAKSILSLSGEWVNEVCGPPKQDKDAIVIYKCATITMPYCLENTIRRGCGPCSTKIKLNIIQIPMKAFVCIRGIDTRDLSSLSLAVCILLVPRFWRIFE